LLSFGSYLRFFGVNCNRIAIYFPFALLGAAGAGELIPEYDYADDFTAEDYRPQVHARLILKFLLGIAK
jgi:hypothetical protein